MMTTSYTPTQVRAVLNKIGVRVEGQTENDFTCFCPFHTNTHSTAFNVSKTSGTFICFTPGCGESGTLLDLVQRVGRKNEFQALRLVLSSGKVDDDAFERELHASFEEQEAVKGDFDQKILDRLRDQFWQVPDGHQYMVSRGFEDDTLRHFDVGYSVKQGMVTVPVHTIDGLPMGMVGRSISDKRFKNSPGLAKSKTVYNGHRARRHGGTIILTEASFDVMSIHQEGFPMVGALLGGTLSKEQVYIINRNFNKIIIFTDFDDKSKNPEKRNPGRDLGKMIEKKFQHKEVLWAYSGTEYVYHDNVKDATDLLKRPGAIKECIDNALSPWEYELLGLY